MDANVVALVKFVQAQYVDDLLRGRLYMNPLSHFVRDESHARGDRYEGQAMLWQGTASQGGQADLKIQLDDGEYHSIPGILTIAYVPPNALAANVFCMYAVHAHEVIGSLDGRNRQFGDRAVIFRGRNRHEFLKRVRSAADKEAGTKVQCGLVEYVDRNVHNGKLGVFRKSCDFSYQNEFRIALLPGIGIAYRFDIGDVSDIAEVLDMNEVTAPEAATERGHRIP